MTNRICSEPLCGRVSICKTLCRKHYKAMKRAEGYKDPLRDKQCKVCEEPFQGRHDQTYCTSHCRVKDSNRNRTRPLHRKPRTILVRCIWCTSEFAIPLMQTRLYCSLRCAEDSAEGIQRAADALHRHTDGCKQCGGQREPFATYCTTCKDKLKREAGRRTKLKAREEGKGWASASNHRSRAKRYGVEYQSITPRDIYQRDGWTCGICSLPVEPDIKYPDNMSASLDHILPMSHGGGHVPDNVQCAHFLCNSIKGDTVG